MLITILNWIFITFLVISFGLPCCLGAFLLFSEPGEARTASVSSLQTPPLIHIVLAGLAAVTVYAQSFSLIGAVGDSAAIIAVILSLLFLFFCRRNLPALFSSIKKDFSIRLFFIYLGEICLTALLSARVPDIEDSYYYHIPTIEWTHQYGTVKGLTSLMPALGFNGSLHSFSALVDWSMFGRNEPLHTVSGYFMIILLLFSTGRLLSCRKNRSFRYSFALDLISIILVLIGTAWISSPVLDMPLTCLLWIILILWCEIAESGWADRRLSELLLLCFYIVFAVTIKLSAAIFVLLAFYPAYLLIKKKQIKEIFLALSIGLLIAAPFLIRNVLISGWLFFPSSFPDLFNANWKLPAEQVNRIAGWATRGSRDPGFLNRNDIPWIVQWFIGSSILKRFLYIVTFLMFIAGILNIIQHIHRVGVMKSPYLRRAAGRKAVNSSRRPCHQKRTGEPAFLFFYSILMIGLIYWFFAAPDTRFGWFYIFPVIIFPVCDHLAPFVSDSAKPPAVLRLRAFFMQKNSFTALLRKILTALALSCLALYGSFYLYRTVLLLKDAFPSALAAQASYDETQKALLGEQSFRILYRNGLQLYQTAKPGHIYFPAAADFRFKALGDTLEDGFGYDPDAVSE